MADLLRSGYKMLNLACPECKNPIFENKENSTAFCPICNREVRFTNKVPIKEKNENLSKNLSSENSGNTIILELKRILFEKVSNIKDLLNKENSIAQIDIYVSILQKILNLLTIIENL